MKRQQSMPANRVSISIGYTFVLVALFISGCDGAGSNPNAGMPPPEVSVVTVKPKTIQAVFEYTGQTAGSREVEVRARVTGILQKYNFTEGGVVTAGQSLFTIDPALYRAAYKRAEADLGAVQARLKQWQREVARLKPLFEAKAVSQKDYDDAVSNRAIAAADAKAARARITEARLNLKYARVEAPISGIAGRALRSEGNYVSGPDVLLTTVTQVDPMYVLFGISDEDRQKLHRETEAGRLVLPADGQFDVQVRLAEGGLYAKTGKMNFTGVNVSGTTGTSEARAELPNVDGLLRPGQFVRVILSGAQRPNAILVPQRAVLEGPQGKFVYVVDGQAKAESRVVELGDWQGDDWIITAGLKTGDRVIVDGVMKIGPGAPVTVAELGTTKPSAAQTPGDNSVPTESAVKH